MLLPRGRTYRRIMRRRTYMRARRQGKVKSMIPFSGVVWAKKMPHKAGAREA